MTMSCSHVRGAEPATGAVAKAMTAAEHKCLAAGERWTASRRRTYELLIRAGRPVKAYDLIAGYADAGETAAKPPTIYRALDFLAAHGLIHRIESLNAFLACSVEGHAHTAQFLICDCCGRAEELDAGIETIAASAAKQRGFTPTRVVMEVHGACADCT
ncbi:MAG: Fur family transcriptional regulator [Alphaproteobacteria bacterium]